MAPRTRLQQALLASVILVLGSHMLLSALPSNLSFISGLAVSDLHRVKILQKDIDFGSGKDGVYPGFDAALLTSQQNVDIAVTTPEDSALGEAEEAYTESAFKPQEPNDPPQLGTSSADTGVIERGPTLPKPVQSVIDYRKATSNGKELLCKLAGNEDNPSKWKDYKALEEWGWQDQPTTMGREVVYAHDEFVEHNMHGAKGTAVKWVHAKDKGGFGPQGEQLYYPVRVGLIRSQHTCKLTANRRLMDTFGTFTGRAKVSSSPMTIRARASGWES